MEGARPEGPRRFGLRRAARITASDEIRMLFRRGKRKRTQHLDVFVSPSPVSFCRVGIVVPKHKHNSVQRNLLKRRLREIARREMLPRLSDAGVTLDLMIRARPEGYQATYEALRLELMRVVEALCSNGP